MPRERLANRRPSATFKFEHQYTPYLANYSVYPDGRAAEIFIDTKDPGSTMAAILRDAAVLTSIALQYGAPLETLRTALTRLENAVTPASPIGSALDALAEEIRGAVMIGLAFTLAVFAIGIAAGCACTLAGDRGRFKSHDARIRALEYHRDLPAIAGEAAVRRELEVIGTLQKDS